MSLGLKTGSSSESRQGQGQGRGRRGGGDLYQEVHQQVDRFLLAQVLRRTDGNQLQAVRILGIAPGPFGSSSENSACPSPGRSKKVRMSLLERRRFSTQVGPFSPAKIRKLPPVWAVGPVHSPHSRECGIDRNLGCSKARSVGLCSTRASIFSTVDSLSIFQNDEEVSQSKPLRSGCTLVDSLRWSLAFTIFYPCFTTFDAPLCKERENGKDLDTSENSAKKENLPQFFRI